MRKKVRKLAGGRLAMVVVGTLAIGSAVWAGGGGGLWLSAGFDRENTRHQKAESTVHVGNVDELAPAWVATTGGDVSATPAVDGGAVYFPDWAGNLFKLDRDTGATLWMKSIGDYTGIPGNLARATPAVDGGVLYIGDQGGRFFAGAQMLAIDADSGDLLWKTTVSPHPAAIVTQSAAVFDGVVYVGVASMEELFAAVVPGYPCCSFGGALLALDAETGAILWETSMVVPGYSGNAIWGSTPVVDTRRGSVYVATGNNYAVPDDFLQCIVDAGSDEDAQFDCLDPGNLFDAVVSMDAKTGAIQWATPVIPFDAWTVACLFGPPGTPGCPDPAGPDFDFGQAPILYKDKQAKADRLAVGQKSGQVWLLDPEDGSIVASTQVGPGGELGGIMWGSSYDGQRLYVGISNSQGQAWTTDGGVTTGGGWAALDPSTAQVLWRTADPLGSNALGAVSSANGLVFACSMDPAGHMYALDGRTGAILWSFASGGSCNAGAAIVNGTVFWGSGYGSLGLPGYTSNDKLFAFELP